MPEGGNPDIPPPPAIHIERTLALIKPDAIHKSDEIEEIILQHGFTILQKRRVHMTPEQTSDFYAEHYGKMFFPSLVAYMSSGPVLAFVLAKKGAITYWRQLIGPTNTQKARDQAPERYKLQRIDQFLKVVHTSILDSLRAIYGTDSTRNALHGSDSYASAERETHFFFPESIVEPISTGQAAKDYLTRSVTPTLLKGLTELCKKKPADPILWLSDWLSCNNPNKPQIQEGAAIVEEPED